MILSSIIIYHFKKHDKIVILQFISLKLLFIPQNTYLKYLIKILNYAVIFMNSITLATIIIYLLVYPHAVMFITNLYLIMLSMFFMPIYAFKIIILILLIFIFNNIS